MRSILQSNNRGQAQSIIIFFFLIIAIFMVGIVILKLVNSLLPALATQLSGVNSQASNAVTYTYNKFTDTWDIAIVLLLGVNILILLISSFLVDIHPAFILIYIVAIIFLFIFGNYALSALDSVWGALGTSTEIAQSPMQIFIINNFQIVMLGIVILSGIIMYAKFKFFGQGEGTGGNY